MALSINILYRINQTFRFVLISFISFAFFCTVKRQCPAATVSGTEGLTQPRIVNYNENQNNCGLDRVVVYRNRFGYPILNPTRQVVTQGQFNAESPSAYTGARNKICLRPRNHRLQAPMSLSGAMRGRGLGQQFSGLAASEYNFPRLRLSIIFPGHLLEPPLGALCTKTETQLKWTTNIY